MSTPTLQTRCMAKHRSCALPIMEGIVKLLLGRGDVNPDSLDKYGQTPLSLAAMRGHEGIVKLLLGREDVNPDSSSKSGRTPLSWAARTGHEGIVKSLLGKKGVNPHSSSKSGQTPLTLAAKNGHDRIVELLQARHSRPIRHLNPRLFLWGYDAPSKSSSVKTARVRRI